jgi:hypothetical protein
MPDPSSPTPSSRPFRIVRPGRKALFAAGVFLAFLLLASVLAVAGIGAYLAPVVYAVILLAVGVGARVFRSPGEPIEPRRAWWMATGSTVLSLTLGGIAAWAFILEVIWASVAPRGAIEDFLLTRSAMVITAALGAFYLNSGVRQAVADERARRETGVRAPRITTVGGKFLYVLAYVLTSMLIAMVGDGVLWQLSIALDLAVLLVGIRIFRGRDEPIPPRRAWWRASGRPTASFVIAGLIAASTVVNLTLGLSGDPDFSYTLAENIATLWFGAFGVALYLNSGIQLRRALAAEHEEVLRRPWSSNAR